MPDPSKIGVLDHEPLVREPKPTPVSLIRRLFFGKPVATEKHEHTLLPKVLALPVFSSDAISSVAYATQEILLVLGAAGAAALFFTWYVSLAIVILLSIVAISYRQTIYAYPSGGGSYIVAKDNLGTLAGLGAAAALLIDYILTVSVSVASGVQNLVAMPFMHPYAGFSVLICLVIVLLLTLANLHGLKESGMMFAIPTYLFVFSCYALVFFGIGGPHLFGWHLHTIKTTPLPSPVETIGVVLLLRAFANGCSAMTGTEAISNGIPAFRQPASRNAAITLSWMAFILGSLFVGISYLAIHLQIHYVAGQSAAVIDQLNSIVFGSGSWFYYVLQGSTVAILVLAANTSFADFPRVSSILARDRFMPRQLANLGDKLVFSNGIIILGILSCILLVSFGGNTDDLIPLYALGVFLAFTLSQAGMVKHWFKEKGSGWRLKAVINGVGAFSTGIVLLDIAMEKFMEGAWITIILIGTFYLMFLTIHRHYLYVRQKLSMDSYHAFSQPFSHTVILLVPSIHRGIMPAIEYARSIGGDLRAVSVEIDPARTDVLKHDWEKWVPDIPLVILNSPYRSLIGPLMAYLDEVQHERHATLVTVVVPEFVSSKWWHSFLHNSSALLVKIYLMQRRDVVVTNVRYFLDNGGTGEGAFCADGDKRVINADS